MLVLTFRQRNTLDNLKAQLELRFDLIRAVTPKFSSYKYTKSASFDMATSDGSNITKALKAVSKTARKWTTIDVDSAASVGGFDRAAAVRKLQEWHNSGAIELQPSGVVNRFRILKDFPKDEKAKDSIISTLYEHIKARESDDMVRVQQVIDLITASSCISRGLALHFGDEECVPEAGCGHCSYCESKTSVPFSRDKTQKRTGRIDYTKFQAILAATSIHDDPRFLARVAFGIGSPRVTAEKLGKHAVFGSMEDCDFEVSETRIQWVYVELTVSALQELVKRFEEVCKA